MPEPARTVSQVARALRGLRGLTRLPRHGHGPGERQWLWEWAVLPALVATIPAFYMRLLDPVHGSWARACYALAGAIVACALGHTARGTVAPWRHVGRNVYDLLLAATLLLAAGLSDAGWASAALATRVFAAALTLLRLLWALQPALRRGSLARLLLLALAVLGACGAGFWWLEPRATTFGDGLWLAFTTAATVGYGDIVPTTPASKIFAVFVVLLGFGVLSLVTAAIAAMWVGSQDRRMEHEILHDLHRQLSELRLELSAVLPRPDDAALPAGRATRPAGATAVAGARRRSGYRRSRTARS